MAENENIENILSTRSITNKASERWNRKTPSEKVRSSLKYKHIFVKHNLPSTDWSNNFSNLTKQQRNILIKGELIRTYDALANIDKTRIKQKFGLSHFASKWFKLSSKDKKILLNSVLNNG